jgi:tRNA (guanine37-N1)-methyltransferase
MMLRSKLSATFKSWELELVPRSYDVVGDIAIIRIPEALSHRAEEIAIEVVKNNQHVRTALRQASPVAGDLRLRKLEWLFGEKRTETIHKEFGCAFKVDLAKCYFSPRLSFERMRIAKQVKPEEVVVNMFAGVGCFSIVIAKYARPRIVFSIDVNPHAIHYLKENVALNKVRHIVEATMGDAKDIIANQLQNAADRVLMPLPEKAYDYLSYALTALKPKGGTIHYYDFVHAGKDENPVEKVKQRVSERMIKLDRAFKFYGGKAVRPVGPRWHQVVLDIEIGVKS